MKTLKIILLFDLSVQLKPDEYDSYWNMPDWKTEKDVKTALENLGHTVVPFGIFNDIEAFLQTVKSEKPDLVFNMSEAFGGHRSLEPNVTALMQMVGVPFTGAGPMSLQMCKDKGLTKVILNYHQIKTPEFLVIKKTKNIKLLNLKSLKDFKYPAFVKPLQLESSEGISQSSYVENEKQALVRIKFIHEKHDVDAIIEEFVDGREVYVSILGNEKLVAFPPRELFFKQVPDNEPKFATYNSKWNQAYRKKWGIDSGWAVDFPEHIQKKIISECKKIYHLLNMQGFGRIDLRIKNEDVYFIEANPNPSIAKKEDYALSAHKAGVEYDDLIAKIVSLSLAA
jgi:D-alanine-D-alanine ligase